MAGYAMIGQSVINVKSGGRGRLSTLCAGVFLLLDATEVEVIGLNEASATMVDKFALHDKDGADDMLMGHK